MSYSIQELSVSEIEEINGGWAFLAHPSFIGGTMGGVGYLGSSAVSGNFSWGGFGTAIGAGAVGAGVLGGSAVSAARGYFATRTAFGGGIGVGLFDRD